MASAALSAAARRDLIDHAVHLAEAAGTDMADRFLAQARIDFELLARQPTIGAPLPLKSPALAGLRKWRIKGFDNHLIFYLPLPNSVRVLRVLHAAQDWWQLLGVDT